MKKFAYTAFASTAALALAACGSADDASVEAEADTVEVAADEAMEGVTEGDAPAADAAAGEAGAAEEAAAGASEAVAAEADNAGDAAAAAAADVKAAAAAAGTDVKNTARDAAKAKAGEMVDKAADAAKDAM